MNPMGNGNTGQQGYPPGAGQPGQYNTVSSGNLYATLGGNITFNTSPPPSRRGLRIDTKVLLIALPMNVIFFFYGMLAYTGRNTRADDWRAGLFLLLFFVTVAMLGRWVRRRI